MGFSTRDNGSGYKLGKAAKETMKEWKAKTGIRAIIPKSENQKAELRKYSRTARVKDAHEMRKISHGAASEVRIIKSEDKS